MDCDLIIQCIKRQLHQIEEEPRILVKAELCELLFKYLLQNMPFVLCHERFYKTTRAKATELIFLNPHLFDSHSSVRKMASLAHAQVFSNL